VVRIAGAGPVAQRHRGRNAGLARQDLAAVLRGEHAQIEEIALEAARLFDFLACHRGKAEGLRHFARAGLVVARGAADDEDAGTTLAVALLFLRQPDLPARLQPFHGQVEIRVGESLSRLPGARLLRYSS